MKKSGDISDEDKALFQQNVKGSRRLLPEKRHVQAQKPRKKLKLQPPLLIEPDITPETQADVSAEERLYFTRPGLQHKIIQKLARGDFPIHWELDLHGLTISQAHQALLQFIQHASEKKERCVCIIHGKGRRNQEAAPILKNKINNWLRAQPQVLAFCSAKPRDGGTGAVYVLLKLARN